MGTAQACVSVVDDDAMVLKSLGRLLQSAGYAVQTFSSGQDFLTHPDGGAPGCIVIDLSMPDLSGLELQQALAKKADRRPVVFISGAGSIAASVAAMKAGAIDFLTKPFEASQLLGVISAAVERDRSSRGAQTERAAVQARLAALTRREREVLEQFTAGASNKEAGRQLGISPRTIEDHRANIMKKLGARNAADLVRIVMTAARSS